MGGRRADVEDDAGPHVDVEDEDDEELGDADQAAVDGHGAADAEDVAVHALDVGQGEGGAEAGEDQDAREAGEGEDGLGLLAERVGASAELPNVHEELPRDEGDQVAEEPRPEVAQCYEAGLGDQGMAPAGQADEVSRSELKGKVYEEEDVYGVLESHQWRIIEECPCSLCVSISKLSCFKS